jgi:hypothetical protein
VIRLVVTLLGRFGFMIPLSTVGSLLRWVVAYNYIVDVRVERL